MYKHSVIIITYNQENYIADAIESVLQQNPPPFEIIIGDDCSRDKTPEILENYRQKFPEIIKVIRHSQNQGIFKNFNFLMDKVNGDVISGLAGDDLYKPGLFNALNKAIEANNLNPVNDSFSIVTNTVLLYPNGKEVIFDNYRIRKNSMFKERLRYGLSYREVGFSKKLWNNINPIPLNYGVFGDWLFGFDQVVKCKKFIFINEVSSVYRLGVGMTSHANVKEFSTSRLQVLDEILIRYSDIIESDDIRYVKFEKSKINYNANPSIANYFKVAFWLLLNANNFSVNNNFNKHWKLLIPNFIKKIAKKIV